MPALRAALWGLVAGSALIVGAFAGYFARTPQRLVAAIMAFGSGVLISALSFDLMDKAYRQGGFDSTAIGFIGGAVIYTGLNWFLAKRGAKHRKRSGDQQPSEDEHEGSGERRQCHKREQDTAQVIRFLHDHRGSAVVVGFIFVWPWSRDRP